MKLRSGAEDALARFVDAWTGLASLFGFSPSTARVSGLLIAAPESLSLGEIAELLRISRGNASMCLKELRSWGVVRRVRQAGDRRDFYEVGGDLYRMTLSIARERKRREFDPVAGMAFAALEDLGKSADPAHAERIAAVREYLETVDRAGRRILENEDAALALAELLRGGPAGRKG